MTGLLRLYSKRIYDGVDYNLTLCRLQSRLQHIYHGQDYAMQSRPQPFARVDLIPQAGTKNLASIDVQHGFSLA